MARQKTTQKEPERKKELLSAIELDAATDINMWDMTDDQIHALLDTIWYPSANEALTQQRYIWDYSYLSYKGIMLWNEVNQKRRANNFGIYVNVPRTFMTIEGIRRNFNINRLTVDIEKMSVDSIKAYKLRNFLNYDLARSGTRGQVRDAGFDKLLFGNGFLYSYLIDKRGRPTYAAGKIGDDGRVSVTSTKNKNGYYGMVARRESVYNIFPDPNGVHFDNNDNINRKCRYVFLRKVKHIQTFKNDWKGIIPDKILDEVSPGGDDMTNYEAVRETVDMLFNYDNMRYPGTVGDFKTQQNVKVEYDSTNHVEERICIGENFMIVQAGSGLKICLVSCNPNPTGRVSLTKLDDIKIPGEFWAMGEPYNMRYQQIEENRVHNAVLDMLHYTISGMIGVNSQYLDNPFDLESYPGKVWKLKPIPGVKISDVFQTIQPNAMALKNIMPFMTEIKSIGQQTTSITDFVTGASKSIADTATETNVLSGASELAIMEKMREMAEEALVNVCEYWLSSYPEVYDNEKFDFISHSGIKMYFTGKKEKDVSEKELTKILTDNKIEPEDVIYLDDLDINNPKLKVTGEIDMGKDFKLKQWVSAIDLGNKSNQIAYNTGEKRRIDIMKMTEMALKNFDVITDPSEFIIDGQPTKMDEMAAAAQNGQGGKATQGEGGGAPESTEAAPQQNNDMAREAQPDNTGSNKLKGK